MTVRTSIGLIALSGMVALGCNDDVSAPADSGPADVLAGTLEVSITVTGTMPDPDGYAVVVSVDGQGDVSSQVESRGGTAHFPDLPAGTHSVRLESLAANCSVEGANPRRFTVLAGGASRIGFAISCPGSRVVGVFERVSPYGEAMEANISLHHGSLSDRYVIREDGTFRWEFQSARQGSWEFLGTYSFAAPEIVFDFDNREWQHTGTLHGNCLTVDGRDFFEDAEYCRPQGTPGT